MVGSAQGQSIALNGATSVDIIPAPAAAGIAHIAGKVTAYNADSVAHDVTVRRFNGTTHFPIEKKAALAAGASYTFVDVLGHVIGDTSSKFTAVIEGAHTTTAPSITVAYIITTG